MRKGLSYRDAVVLLGGDPPAVAALDRALAGALAAGTGGLSDAVLNVFDAQGRIIRLGRDVVGGLRRRVQGAGRVDRTRRLHAAHTVLVIASYFEALAVTRLPFDVRDLRLARDDQVALAGGFRSADGFVEALVAVAPPRPAPHLPFERCLDLLEVWYQQLSARLADFVHDLAVWADLDQDSRAEADAVLDGEVCQDAVERYRRRYMQLAVEVPEFRFWSGQVEHQATRAEVRRALAGIEELLAASAAGREVARGASALSTAYRAVLNRPILTEGESPTGVQLPTLDEGYLDPDFRVRSAANSDNPGDDGWWADVPVRCDLTDYLAGVLTSPEARVTPLMVLGQPGAGKSVLTKVLAARLPPTDFLPVRVALREVPAEAEVQDQIEYAIRAATGLRLDWPAVAGEADGAVPVVLLDGFDELLQVTGVNQSDYLIRVARFQQREADQGRPVVVLVTSRTAVADRVLYPDDTVVLRLEPFREEQITRWLEIWNSHNESYLSSRGLAPLPTAIAIRHEALASEPLLLMMLALYDADANALQRVTTGDGGQALDEARLYEQLLTSFAVREVAKTAVAVAADELSQQVEQEMQQLSLIAFAMINRRRQWVTEDELEHDLTELLGRAAAVPAGFRAPLSQARAALGRFFFVQRAQAVQDGSHRQTYEFLHATFGEYLAARLTVQLATDLLTARSTLAVGHAPPQDDLLYALSSFAPLSSRQMLRFVRSACGSHVPEDHRRHLAGVLLTVLTHSETRTGHLYARYRPVILATTRRHGIYSANLVLLILSLATSVTASELFPQSDDPPGSWHRRALLWRSAMSENEWTDLAAALTVQHIWNGSVRELRVQLADQPDAPTETVDLYWHYRYPPGHPDRGHIVWHKPYWDQRHKMGISGGTNDTVVRHALDPLYRWLGPSIATFRATEDGPAFSIANGLLDLWLTSALGPGGDDLAAAYGRLDLLLDLLRQWDPPMQRRGVIVFLSLLRADAARLPTAHVVRYLSAALLLARGDPRTLQLALECALQALPLTEDDTGRVQLSALAARVIVELRQLGPHHELLAWITVHTASPTERNLFDEEPGHFLIRFPFDIAEEADPELIRRARVIIKNRFPDAVRDAER